MSYEVHECQWWSLLNQNSKFEKEAASFQYLPGNGPWDHATHPTTCNDISQYTHVALHENNLQGILPLEVYLLTSLQSLGLFANFNLQGSLSAEYLPRLTNLTDVNIGYTAMSGTLPSTIGLLSQLQSKTQSIIAANSFVHGILYLPFLLLIALVSIGGPENNDIRVSTSSCSE
jgi:hypothetical protein